MDRRGRRSWVLAAVGVLVLPMLVLGGLTVMSTASDASEARVVSAEAFEATYGVRFDLVGVTAAGGLVDLRFTVTDSEKASHLFHDDVTSPAIYLQRTGSLLRMKHGMIHRLTLVNGGRYFALFSNAGGVVQAGTEVSVVIGDVRTEPIAAQS